MRCNREGINTIIKGLAVARLKAEGGVDDHKGHTIEFSERPNSRKACPIPHVCPICSKQLNPTKIKVCERH